MPSQGMWLNLCRREFLRRSGISLGAIALSQLLGERGRAQTAGSPEPENPLAPRRPHFMPRAKHVIYLHMIGAPSQLDLFDYKPALLRHDGQVCPEDMLRGRRFGNAVTALSRAVGSRSCTSK